MHELEIENTETQSACLLREFQIKRKDMVILKFRQHQNLCDQIIQRQKQIMEGKVDVSTWKLTLFRYFFKHDNMANAYTVPIFSLY